MVAADAQRLRDDPAYRSMFETIRGRALMACVYDVDAGSREQARMLVIAIDTLHSEAQMRIDTAIEIERHRQMDRVHE